MVLEPLEVVVDSRPVGLEEGERVGERNEQRIPRLDRLARDEVTRIAEAVHNFLVGENGKGKGGLSDAARA